MKNSIKIILVLASFSLFALFSFSKTEKQINIVIDAGHGGNDIGAEANELMEKDIVSAISKKISILNKDENIKIHFTRIDDENINLSQRVLMINTIKPDLVVSLHANTVKDSNTNGFEIYVSEKSIAYKKSNDYAKQLDLFFTKNYPLKSRGIKNAPFLILKKSEVPTLTLELGFISNKVDSDFLNNDSNHDKIALLLLDFLSNLKS